MEICDRVLARDNDVTIRWVPAHHGIQGNEKTDGFAKAAAGRSAPCSDGVSNELRWETSLSRVTRSATEPDRAARPSGSPAASVPAGTSPLRGEAFAASTFAVQERS